ncbi:MAG: DNA-directed RNA polymerase subunit B [archaeon]
MSKGKSKVFINGSLIGFCNNSDKIKKELIKRRRNGDIDPQINISINEVTGELNINSDSGRVQRPLIILDNGKSRLTKEILEDVKNKKTTWNDLVVKGIIEYLDSEEEENCLVALNENDITPDHTHLEISGCAIFSLTTSTIPFVEHDLAARAVYAAKTMIQGVGIPVINYNLRFDTEMYVLNYPQKPLIKTKVDDLLDLDRRPMIQNAVLAIMPFSGYNILDAVIINKGSVDRALGRMSYYRTYSAQETRYPSGQTDKFTIPTADIVGFRGDEAYKNINVDGAASIETFVEAGGVVIGMTSPPRFVEEISEFGMVNEERRETSLTSRKQLYGYVDKVMFTDTVDGSKLCKVKVRTPLIPLVGDKFASKHGQKGVVGAIIPEEDMPFTSSGIKPDLIINPHGIPSRMAVGQLFEAIAAKAVASSGKEIDGTAFYSDKNNIYKILKEYGFREDGKEVLYDGKTGERIEMPIFIGPIAYERLYHSVINKLQARDKGPVQLLTRQPTEGKEKGGGIRFGEMEGEALVSHGTAMLLQEKLNETADQIDVLVCADCGVLAVDDKIRNKRYCPICQGNACYPVKMSYGFKLLIDELKSMGVFPKLHIGDKVE